jgi:hypothetical protein
VKPLRGRFDFPTLRERAIAYARAHKVNKVLIEVTELGRALVTELASVGLSAIGIKPQHDKQTRLSIQSVKFAVARCFSPTERHGSRTWRPSCSLSRWQAMTTRSTRSVRPWRIKSRRHTGTPRALITLLLQQRLMRLTEAEAGGQGRGKYQRMIRAMVNEAITD